ncbi:MAG: DM13 domain-containing protein [Elainellaceae cyanobacterium]
MRRHHWLMIGLISLVAVGCAGGSVSDSAPEPGSESPIAQTSETPIAQTSPTSSEASSQEVIKSGGFESGEHPTQGTAQIVNEGGESFLVFDDSFQTDDGPDLVVILHRSNDLLGSTEPPAYPINEGDYVVLAPLQSVSGTQRYAIPADVAIDEYQSAGIWCRQFNATFGAATLQ